MKGKFNKEFWLLISVCILILITHNKIVLTIDSLELQPSFIVNLKKAFGSLEVVMVVWAFISWFKTIEKSD